MAIRKRISIRDIAKKLNLSHATVSMAIRGVGKISEKTKIRVRKTASEMGYTPDPNLAILASYRKAKGVSKYCATICWLNTWEKLSHYNSFHEYAAFLKGADAAATAIGYKLEVFNFLDGFENKEERFFNILKARGIQGIIIPPIADLSLRFQHNFRNFSVVAIGYSLVNHLFHTVSADYFRSAFDACSELKKMGFNRIGMVISDNQDKRTFFRYRGGFVTAQEVLGLDISIPPLHLPKDDKMAQKIFIEWRKVHSPDAILQADKRVMNWVSDRTGVASLGIVDNGQVYYGIQHPSEVVGQTAVHFLANMLMRNEVGVPDVPIRSVVAGKWLATDSVP